MDDAARAEALVEPRKSAAGGQFGDSGSSSTSRWSKDTGALTRERMQTIDEEVLGVAQDFITRRHAAETRSSCGSTSRTCTTRREVPRKVVKGGSFLCADSYCLRYRPAARRPQQVDTGMSHLGFRCVRPGP